MPDPESLSPEKRAALLGCVKNKNKKWASRHNGRKPKAVIIRKHFSECARATGVEQSVLNKVKFSLSDLFDGVELSNEEDQDAGKSGTHEECGC